MAKLSPKPYPGNWDLDFTAEDLNAEFAKQDAQLDRIFANQPALDEQSIVGACLEFPVADGKAFYVVIKDKPLTIAHVPVGDAWHIDECTLRGINASYVRRSLQRNLMLKELFARKEKENSCPK